MRSSWRLLSIVAGIAIAAAVVYSFGESVAQLRALLRGAAPSEQDARPAIPLIPEVVPPPDDLIAPAAGIDVDPDASDDALADGELEPSPPAGPPTGAEFARLLEEGLIDDADPELVEDYLRALRDADAAEDEAE